MTQPTAIARRDEPGAELAQRKELTLEMVSEITGYSPAEIALVSKTVAIGAPLIELAMFLKACRSSNLDPILRQAHWIRRKQPDGSKKGAMQTGIDGYRAIADRQGNYAGSEPATFRGYIEITYKGKKYTVPEKATVICWKIVQGHKAAFTGEARWSEFYPGDEQGFMWIKMPHHQLGKCAEAQALRKGWPAILGGVQMAPEFGESAPQELEEVGGSHQVVVTEEPRSARPKPTAADYDRIIASHWPDEQPAPEQRAEPTQQAESDEERELDDAFGRNKNLLDEAQKYHVPALGKYKAEDDWPLERIEAANTALGERIKEKNGDAEIAKKQDATLG